MKRLTASLSVFMIAVPLAAQEFSTAPMRAINMAEAFSLSLAKSETLAQQGEGVNSLEAAERVIRANFRPEASFNGYQFWQDTADSTVSNSPTSKMQVAVNVHYNVFSGMRDYLAARAAGTQTESARLLLLRAKQNFYQSVAEAYLNLLSFQDQIEVRKAQLSLTKGRIKELEERERIGRSRKSEVLAAQAQLAQDEAQLQGALGRERIAQQLLKFLTGVDADLAPRPVGRPALPGLDETLARIAQRADIVALRKNVAIVDTQVDIQRKQRWPTFALDSNYYPKRPDSSAGIRWDLTASLQFPLYTGGQITAQVDQASSARRVAELALELAERQAKTAVRQNYDNLAYALSTLKALENALELAKQNLDSQSADYRYGLVTNIDVLAAMDSMQQTRLSLEQAYVEAYRASVALEVAAGGPAGVR